jgi:hypothetical protein
LRPERRAPTLEFAAILARPVRATDAAERHCDIARMAEIS